jgi:hypothetical protein
MPAEFRHARFCEFVDRFVVNLARLAGVHVPSLTNTDIEKHYFEMFRKHHAIPAGRIEYGDKPDVIIHGHTSIGIEITNFFLEDGAVPTSEQVQKKARHEVVSKAHLLYQANSCGKFELTFGFDRAAPIRYRNSLASDIAQLPARIDLRETGQLDRNLFKHIPELEYLYLNAREYDDAKWRVIHSYDGEPTMSLDRLREIVRAKEAKSRHYRPCDAYWLLIVVDFMDRAQDQEIFVAGIETVHSTVFKNIIVYKTLFGHLVETNPESEGSSA